MSAVSTIRPHIQSVQAPDALRALPGWLMWRYEDNPSGGKPLKVPYYTNGAKRSGVQGRQEDRQQLTTFDAARSAAARRGFDGVGFCPMPEWCITAFDFDNCVADGGVHPDVERLVAGTYAEFSPSGTGVRAFVRGQVGNNKDAHGDPFGVEVFSSKGFVTFSGNVLDIARLTEAENTVGDITDSLLELCQARFRRTASTSSAPASPVEPLGLTADQMQRALDVLDPSMPRADWLRVGMALHHETGGSDEGLQLWDQWSSNGSTYPGPDDMAYRWGGFGKYTGAPTTAHALVAMANANGAHIETAALEGDVFDVLPDEPKVEKPLRWQMVPAHDFAQGPAPRWIVRDVLPDAELVVLVGESTAGKSFIAIDLSAAIARGVEWRGKRVKQGRVAYVVAEGAGGFRKRITAYEQKNGSLEGHPFSVIHAAPNLLQHDDAVEVCKVIKAGGGADVIVIDTFAQVTPGANENAAEDIGKALGHCKSIHKATGAVVLLVHHHGKDTSRGARGWSGLKAAADAEIEVLRTPGGRVLRTSKQKDGEDNKQWGFDLEIVPVGLDEDGEIETSCVVVEAELPAVGQVGEAMKRAGPVTKAVIAVVSEIAESQTTGIELKFVVDGAAARLPAPEDGKRDTRKQRVRRAILELCEGDSAPYFLEGDSLSIV